jgi:hypothetical protein
MSGGRGPAVPIPPEEEHTMTRPLPAPTRDGLRRSIADELLEALDKLVTRHRALALHDEHIELHAELIAAEVAHQLAMARSALHRHPSLRRAG